MRPPSHEAHDSASWPRGMVLGWLLLGLVLLAALGLSTEGSPRHGGLGADGRIYVAMARAQTPADGPAAARARIEAHVAAGGGLDSLEPADQQWALANLAPFGRRVLSPTLARWLPGDEAQNLRRLNQLALLASWLLLGALLRAAGCSPGGSLLAGLLWIGAAAAVRLTLRQPYYLEPQTQALWLAGLWFVASGRDRWLPLFVALAVLQKESLAALLPVAAAARWSRRGRLAAPDVAWFGLGLALVAGTLGALHLAIQPLNDYDPLATWTKFARKFATREGQWVRWPLGVAVGAGLLPLLPLAAPRTSWASLRRDPWLAVALTFALLALFGGSDTSRLVGMALGPLAVLAARAWDERRRLFSLPGLRLPWALGTLAVHLVLCAQLQVWSVSDPPGRRLFPGRAQLRGVQREWDQLWPWIAGWALLTALALLAATRSTRRGPGAHGQDR